MSFKRLELYGFKSFADKTVIDIHDGITCIVGPNGSGKSNFSDAIKWVLGEQRASELRGKSMKDVIFNGTDSRGSMSFCEISLVFDNADRRLFPTLAFDEVIISRKLYRNGESEYLLNRVSCKLRDITELISDTGLGKSGFSIIGQGQVAKIINSKPEDRRLIFEEAAGISKYKKRKNEAENKLNQTRSHLERFCDIIKEIERTLPKLEAQSADARKFLEYHEALKRLEINHYLYLFENNKHVKAGINDKISGIEQEIAQIVRDLAKLDEEYFNNTVEVSKTDDIIKDITEQRTNFLLEKERKRGHTNVLVERLESIRRDIAKTQENIERLKAQSEEKQAQVLSIEQKNIDASEALVTAQANYDIVDTQYMQVVDEILSYEQEMDANSRNFREGMAKLVDVNADKSMLIAERDFTKQSLVETVFYIDKDKIQIAESEALKRAVNAECAKAKEARDKVYAQRVDCRNRVNNCKANEQVLTKEVGELTQSVTALETKRTMLNNIKENYDSYNASVQNLMEECKVDFALNKKVMGVVAELIKVDERYEVAIEVALGANIQHIAATSEDDVRYIIDVLKRKKLGRLTILPIDVMRPRDIDKNAPVFRERGCIGKASDIITYDSKFGNLFSNLLGATLIFDTYDNAMAVAAKYNRQYRLVTLEGELIAQGGAITGGSRRADNSRFLSQDRDLDKIEDLLKRATRAIEVKSQALKDAKSGYEENLAKLQEIDDSLQSLEINYATNSEREEQAEGNLEALLAHMSEFTLKRSDLEMKLAALDDAIASKERLRGDIADTQASVDGDNSKSRELFEERKREKDRLLEEREKLKLTIAEYNLHLENSALDVARLNEEIVIAQDASSEESEALRVLSENAKLAEGAVSKSDYSERDLSKMAKFDGDIKEKEDYRRQLNERILAINEQKKQLNVDDRIAHENKIKQENSLEKIDAQMYAMTERLREEYSVEHDDAKALQDPEYVDDGAAQEIINYKRKITNLGVVNVAAIEEFQVESERYDSMVIERDDLLNSEGELLKIIGELSTQMKNIFDTEFEKISNNFKKTFKEIFGGGSGELLIDKDAEDPLAAGVDIIMQPPGKKPGALTLFSGGEMALTAIAILFAILMTRPMPFCVLDEMEAALDETNARLFAKYIRRFVQNTQFIVITHRKPTMEQADRLYGVTMEEKGVSKVVSVELNEARKFVSDDKPKQTQQV